MLELHFDLQQLGVDIGLTAHVLGNAGPHAIESLTGGRRQGFEHSEVAGEGWPVRAESLEDRESRSDGDTMRDEVADQFLNLGAIDFNVLDKVLFGGRVVRTHIRLFAGKEFRVDSEAMLEIIDAESSG